MVHEQSETFPTAAELARMLQHQQQRIYKLSEEVAGLQARMAELEGRLDRIDRIGQLIMAMTEVLQEREQATRDALRHLDEPAYLAESWLAKLIARRHGQMPDGHSVQDALSRAIHGMKPNPVQPHQKGQAHRRYAILRLTYLEKKKAAEVASALTISRRQYYRDLKAAIQKVADEVLDSWP